MISSMSSVDVTMSWACCWAMSPCGFITTALHPLRAMLADKTRTRKRADLLGYIRRYARGLTILHAERECKLIEVNQLLDILS